MNIFRLVFLGGLVQFTWSQVGTLAPLWDTARVLENPHKGWYHHYPDNGIHRYPTSEDSDLDNIPGLDHIFIRLAWSFFEPNEGQYDWRYIDSIVDHWVPKGYQIGLAITAKETRLKYATPDSVLGYATPKWVYDAGAKGTKQDTGYWEPDYDDPIFLEKLNNFHAAVGKRYGNKPWLSYVQVASYGSWGEGHNWPHSNKTYPFSTLKKHIDLYLKNYPGVKICVSDDIYSVGVNSADMQTIKNYVEEKGLFWTDHSILVEYHNNTYPLTFSIRSPEVFHSTWKTRPVQLELEHYQKVKNVGHWTVPNGITKGQSVLRGAIELAHATWVGYHGDAKMWYSENPDITRDLVNRIGYWFLPVSINFPASIAAGKSHTLQITWRNKGVAPAYNRYQLQLKLQNNNNSYTQVLKEANNTTWMPGEDKTENYTLNLPNNFSNGTYQASIRLVVDTLPNARVVDLALKENIKDSQGFFSLTTIQLEGGTIPIKTLNFKNNDASSLEPTSMYLLNGKYYGYFLSSQTKNLLKVRENVITLEKNSKPNPK